MTAEYSAKRPVMRRSRISHSCPLSCRNGVSANVSNNSRNAQIPMYSCVASMGLSPSPLFTTSNACRFIQINGSRHAVNQSGLMTQRTWVTEGNGMAGAGLFS